MLYLYLIAAIALMISTVSDTKKTIKSIKIAWTTFIKTAPLLFLTISLVSIVLYYLPDHVIAEYLGTSDLTLGVLIASVLGSISLLPGFISFPLSGLLLKQGVSYTVLAVFTTTLMMVGVLTLPLEKEFFGTRIAIARNISGLIIALIVSIVIGIAYGEIL